jgi:hypothetical protein
MSGGAHKLSGLQKEVLALYRNILREAVKKDRDAAVLGRIPVISLFKASDVGKTSCYKREEFRRQAGTVRRSDFKAIDYRIRKGQKQVKLLCMPGVTGAHLA